MTESEFIRQSQAAVDRMREMNMRSKIPENNRHKMPPSPSFVKVNNNTEKVNLSSEKKSEIPNNEEKSQKINLQQQRQYNGLNIPFLDNILKDGDSTLILGLLLILLSENTDRILLFALIYILI